MIPPATRRTNRAIARAACRHALSFWYDHRAARFSSASRPHGEIVKDRGGGLPQITGATFLVLLSVLAAANAYASPCNGECDLARDVVIDAAGRIVVAGVSQSSIPARVWGWYPALWRFTENGRPDTGFGDGGATYCTTEGAGIAVAVQDDGRIVALQSVGTEVYLARHGPDGAALSPAPAAPEEPFWSWTIPGECFAKFDRYGRVVVAANQPWVRLGEGNASLRRIAADGTEEPGFGGVLQAPPGAGSSYSHTYGIAIDESGGVVVIGATGAGATFWPYTSDGLPDRGFGENGVMSHPQAYGRAVSTDGSGRILVGGRSTQSGYIPEYDVGIYRLNPDGSLDRSFGEDGVVSYDRRTGGLRGGENADE
jgi:uncharacterized delta-60 repeat protein